MQISVGILWDMAKIVHIFEAEVSFPAVYTNEWLARGSLSHPEIYIIKTSSIKWANVVLWHPPPYKRNKAALVGSSTSLPGSSSICRLPGWKTALPKRQWNHSVPTQAWAGLPVPWKDCSHLSQAWKLNMWKSLSDLAACSNNSSVIRVTAYTKWWGLPTNTIWCMVERLVNERNPLPLSSLNSLCLVPDNSPRLHRSLFVRK